MDIISEILETDRLAEEKLEAAMQRRNEMLEESQRRAEQIKSDAKVQAEEYRKSLTDGDGENDAGGLKEKEQASLKELAEAYEKNHETWEDEIVAAITG